MIKPERCLLISRTQDQPFLPAPAEKLISQGEYELVKVVAGKGPAYPAQIKKGDISEHGIIVGPSGAGKTTWLPACGLANYSSFAGKMWIWNVM